MPRAVVAPNAFTGSISAVRAAAALAEGLREAGWEATECPVADGGPGTREVLEGRLLEGVAVVETAEYAGLQLGLDPLRADTFEVGLAVLSAAGAGAREVWIGLGGSRTTDGGTGFARALGWRFLDSDGRELPPGGGALVRLAAVVPGPRTPPLVALSDVEAPLLDAADVFAPQKGAGPEEVELLRAGLARLQEAAGLSGEFPGAGAAGGLGYGIVAFGRGVVRSGVEVVARAVGLESVLAGAHLCITGEGSVDRQTLGGKAPAFVARAASTAGVPLALVAGRIDEAVAAALGAARRVELAGIGPDPIGRAAEYLREAGRRLAGDPAGGGPGQAGEAP